MPDPRPSAGWVDGEGFACVCGSRSIDRESPHLYRCTSCGEAWYGEPKPRPSAVLRDPACGVIGCGLPACHWGIEDGYAWSRCGEHDTVDHGWADGDSPRENEARYWEPLSIREARRTLRDWEARGREMERALHARLDALEAELEAATGPVDPAHVLRALRRARGGSE